MPWFYRSPWAPQQRYSDIYGTLRQTNLTYAGAFEGGEFLEDAIKNVANGEIRIACEGDQIRIMAGSELQSVKLYDLQGRTVVSQQDISANACLITAPGKGAYIVETQTNGVRNVQKIIVR